MAEIKKRGLDNLLSQNYGIRAKTSETPGCTKTLGFKVTERPYETYRRFAKYFGAEELIRKWRADLEMIEREKDCYMESVEI